MGNFNRVMETNSEKNKFARNNKEKTEIKHVLIGTAVASTHSRKKR